MPTPNDNSHQPLVSVIMNCLNGEKYLREAIDSVYAQTYKNWEIIFWDNASTDASPDIAKSYGERLRYFRSKLTYPLGQARNLAIAKAKGEYIALLDCDDVWLPQKLGLQVRKIEADRALGLVYADSYFIDENGNVTGTFFERNKPQQGETAWWKLLIKPNFIPCPTVLIRRSAYESLGGINSDLTFTEEYELCLRIAFAFDISYIDEPLARYRLHASNLTGTGSLGTTKEQIFIIKNWLKEINSQRYIWMIRKRLLELRCKQAVQLISRIYGK